mmetsp:Transcript_20986/g.35407  ORF Transcript_20986/g.35407 Transcript_20986/m.35407 type:complete len:230 (-) Transcript_20986:697-1386(-)
MLHTLAPAHLHSLRFLPLTLIGKVIVIVRLTIIIVVNSPLLHLLLHKYRRVRGLKAVGNGIRRQLLARNIVISHYIDFFVSSSTHIFILLIALPSIVLFLHFLLCTLLAAIMVFSNLFPPALVVINQDNVKCHSLRVNHSNVVVQGENELSSTSLGTATLINMVITRYSIKWHEFVLRPLATAFLLHAKLDTEHDVIVLDLDLPRYLFSWWHGDRYFSHGAGGYSHFPG